MGVIDKEDWRDWWSKIKWLLVSFKFMSFCVFVVLLVGSWFSLGRIFTKNIKLLEDLHQKGLLDQAQVSDIIGKMFEVLYDKSLSHILLFIGGVMASIIAIKGVSYWVSEKQISSMVSKLEPVAIKQNLDKIIRRKN